MLDINTLRELIAYDALTGDLRWKTRGEEYFSSARDCAAWNGRYADSRALNTLWKSGYRAGHISGKTYLAHRVAWALHTGSWPSLQIDHIDGDRGGNKAANLRVVSPAGNQRNVKQRVDNTTGAKGVDFRKASGRWRARIVHQGNRITLGLFDNFEDAVAARKQAEIDFGYHPNHGRVG